MSNFDIKLIGLAKHVACWSKDRSRKVGCVIAGPNNEIRTTGYNGFPRGVNDDVEYRHERPMKYKWTEHAERNAIYNAARNGISISGCTIYVPWYPCMDCARAIVQSGISKLVCYHPDWDDPVWKDDFREVPHLLREARIEVTFL